MAMTSIRLASRAAASIVAAPGARAFAASSKPLTVADAVLQVKENAKVRVRLKTWLLILGGRRTLSPS